MNILDTATLLWVSYEKENEKSISCWNIVSAQRRWDKERWRWHCQHFWQMGSIALSHRKGHACMQRPLSLLSFIFKDNLQQSLPTIQVTNECNEWSIRTLAEDNKNKSSTSTTSTTMVSMPSKVEAEIYEHWHYSWVIEYWHPPYRILLSNISQRNKQINDDLIIVKWTYLLFTASL